MPVTDILLDLDTYFTQFSQTLMEHSPCFQDLLDIFTQVCLGLKSFHECGAVHGNLTLSNVFVETDAKGYVRTDLLPIINRKLMKLVIICRSPFGKAPLVKLGTPDLCGKFSSVETILSSCRCPLDLPCLAPPERQVCSL